MTVATTSTGCGAQGPERPSTTALDATGRSCRVVARPGGSDASEGKRARSLGGAPRNGQPDSSREHVRRFGVAFARHSRPTTSSSDQIARRRGGRSRGAVTRVKLLRDRGPAEPSTSRATGRRARARPFARRRVRVVRPPHRSRPLRSRRSLHGARPLTKPGEDVVVKADQRTKIAATSCARDIEAMSWLAPHLWPRPVNAAAIANPPAAPSRCFGRRS